MRERSGRQDVPKRSGPKGWRGLLVWCPLRMLLLAHSKRGTEHFFPRPLTRSGGRGKNVAGGGGGVWKPGCQTRRAGGAGPQAFSSATTACPAPTHRRERGKL